jgi:putative transcriptional regulator
VIDHLLAPGFLIASPKLDGSPFERAVIVMVHHDDQGAMGFIINKALDIDFGSLLQSADEKFALGISDRCYDIDVHFGGPVRVEQLWVIYNQAPPTPEELEAAEQDGSLFFGERWFLASSSEVIERIASGQQAQAYRPFVGYTGWGPGQLEGELEEGSWLCLGFDDELLFEVKAEEAWSLALDRLGVSPMAFTLMGKMAEA